MLDAIREKDETMTRSALTSSGTNGRPLASVLGAGPADGFTPDEQFRAEATQVLASFRQAVERVTFSVTARLANSRTLLNALGVDLNVSWQIFKLLGPIETLATVAYLPASVSFTKLLAAAKKKGASEDALTEAVAAFAAVERFVAETTGDREQFETAVMSYAELAESAQVNMHHRKAAFKADVHFFGVAVDTLAFAMLFHPGQRPDTVDFVGLRQMIGLRRLRASTDVVVDRWRMALGADARDGLRPNPLGDAFDPDAAAVHNAVVIPEFSSRPVPPLVTTVQDSGDVRTLLKHRDVGVGQPFDVTTGRVFRGTPIDRTPDGRTVFQGLVEIARPTRLQVIDTFVHRPTWPNLVPTSGVFAHLPQRIPAKVERDGVRLPFGEKTVFLGSGPDAVRLTDAPRHADLVRYACQKMGWRLDDMDLYRVRIEYPLMDSNILCRLEVAGLP